jgi:hypothetical protein
MKLQTAKPSTSYYLVLPEGVSENHDGRTSSYWLNGAPLLLQLSSYIRTQGEQPTAWDRLNARISKEPRSWQSWRTKIHDDVTLDQEAAEYTDDQDVVWVHVYFVWPHLTVYATISGPEELVSDHNNWAFQGLRSMQLTTQ